MIALLASLAVAALWGLGGAALAWSGVHAARRRKLHSRVNRLGIRAPHATDHATGPEKRRLLRFFGMRALHTSSRPLEGLPNAIERAGLVGRVSPADIVGSQAIGLVLGLVIGISLATSGMTIGLFLLLGGPLVGWFAPVLWLRGRGKARAKLILRALPTAIDLLALCMEAGLGLDRSLRTISEGQKTPLSDEFLHVLADIDLGSSRRDAFSGLTVRVESDELRSLVTALVQSEELGTSLLPTIQAQARQVRLGRRRAAEKAALQAPVKMTVPMVMFILPALFMVVLGPAAVQMSQQSIGP